MKKAKNVDGSTKNKLPSMKKAENVDDSIKKQFPSMKMSFPEKS